MILANNFMQSAVDVLVTGLEWNESVAPRRATIGVVVAKEEEYTTVCAFLEHPKGSALKTLSGELWYLRRLADDCSSSATYPRNVEFLVEEVPSEERNIPAPPPPYSGDEIATWLIPIASRWDLAQDLPVFGDLFEADIQLAYRGERPYLTSDRFLAASSIDEAMELARELVTVLNAAASLAAVAVGNYRPIELDSDAIVVLKDGREIEHPRAPSLRVSVRAGAENDIWLARRKEAIRKAAVAQGSRPGVAQVLQLWASPTPTWASLYVILELVESDAGATAADLGWVSNKRRELFKHTANSVPVDVRTLARHGSGKPPPKNPMTFSAAVEFVRDLIGESLLSLAGDENPSEC
jgi:hypothetical protein